MSIVTGIGNWTMARASVTAKKNEAPEVSLLLTDPAGYTGDVWTYSQTIGLNDIQSVEQLRNLCNQLIDQYNEAVDDMEEEKPSLAGLTL